LRAFKLNAELVYPLEYISHTSFGLNTSGLYTTLAIKPEKPGTWALVGLASPPIKMTLLLDIGDATFLILKVLINLPSIYTSIARLYTLTDILTHVCNGKLVIVPVEASELYTLLEDDDDDDDEDDAPCGLLGSTYIFKSLVVFEKYNAK
jgi:hypothetical protein